VGEKPTFQMPTLVGNIWAITPQGVHGPTQVSQTKYKC